MGKTTLAVTWGIIAVACSGPPPPPPSAIINASPTSVCVGDNFKTPIHLDALSSSTRLTLVYTRPDPDAGPLKLSWSFAGDAVQIDPGSVEPDGTVDGDTVLLAMAGERPLQVTLTVTNTSTAVDPTTDAATVVLGSSATATMTISITPLDPDGTCPLPQTGP